MFMMSQVTDKSYKEYVAIGNQQNQNEMEVVVENNAMAAYESPNDRFTYEEPTCNRNILQTESQNVLEWNLLTSSEIVTKSDKNVKKRKVVHKTEIIQSGGKRQRHYEQWKSTQRHMQHLSGGSYISSSGKKVEARKLKPPCHCAKKCYEKISEDLRMSIFKSFWDVNKSHDLKRQYIRCCLDAKTTDKVKKKAKVTRKRKYITYSFPVNGSKVEVCQLMFLNTLSISSKVAQNILKNEESGFIKADQRGKHVPKSKTPDGVIENVKKHIGLFPCQENNSARKRTEKKYLLDPNLNFEKMYQLYLQFCLDNKIEPELVAKKWVYVDVFHNKFNLAFKTPASDKSAS